MTERAFTTPAGRVIRFRDITVADYESLLRHILWVYINETSPTYGTTFRRVIRRLDQRFRIQ